MIKMILTKEVKVKINNSNKKHFENLGYQNLVVGEGIVIPIEHLKDGSNHKIEVLCDVCGNKMEREYYSYKKSFDNGGYFACSNKCSYSKKQKTFKEKYGVEHLLQSEEIKNRMKINNMLKYGVTNVNQSDIIKIKKKEIFLERYGVENPSQLDDFKIKKEKTSLKNYGVKYHNQSEEYFKNVFRKSNKIKKYNENLYYQSSYEKHFLNYCDNIGFLNEIENFNHKIKYNYNKNIRYYFPDFYVKKLNLIIEIKSKYYYDKYIETNLLKKNQCLSNGYNYIFIINKNYSEFEKIINYASISL